VRKQCRDVNSGGVLAGTGTIFGRFPSTRGLLAPGVNTHAPLIDTLTVSNDLTLAATCRSK